VRLGLGVEDPDDSDSDFLMMAVGVFSSGPIVLLLALSRSPFRNCEKEESERSVQNIRRPQKPAEFMSWRGFETCDLKPGT
jgi:hypothetical protein